MAHFYPVETARELNWWWQLKSRLNQIMDRVNAINTVPGELFAKFQTSFYSDPVDAVFKALGVD